MAHHIYVTPGFVIDSKNRGDANKLLSIFTRDLGLILVSAQGIRHLKSKLRFHTDLLSYAEFSVVRGKEMWRLTGASGRSEEQNFLFETLRTNSEYKLLFAKLFSLLKRLLHGEDPNVELYQLLVEGLTFLSQERVTGELLAAFEHIIVIRMLASLGYISGKGKGSFFITQSGWNIPLLESAAKIRHELTMEINNALRESHL